MPYVFRVKSGGECCQVRELAYMSQERAAQEAIQGFDKARKAKTVEKMREVLAQYEQRVYGALSVERAMFVWQSEPARRAQGSGEGG